MRNPLNVDVFENPRVLNIILGIFETAVISAIFFYETFVQEPDSFLNSAGYMMIAFIVGIFIYYSLGDKIMGKPRYVGDSYEQAYNFLKNTDHLILKSKLLIYLGFGTLPALTIIMLYGLDEIMMALGLSYFIYKLSLPFVSLISFVADKNTKKINITIFLILIFGIFITNRFISYMPYLYNIPIAYAIITPLLKGISKKEDTRTYIKYGE